MSLMSWNCQGAGSPETVQRLRNMRRKYFPDFLFLMETKQKDSYVIRLRDSLGYEYGVTVEPQGLSGGLAVFWKKSYDVEVLHSDSRVIDLKVKMGSIMFFLTCVYGDPVRALRHHVWEFLAQIGEHRDEAWILTGDFNELMYNTEKMGGPPRHDSSFWDFRNFATNCKIRELQSSGNWFSWGGWRDKIWVQCRLDRSFGNDNWFRLFPRSHMEYLEMWASDHRPILISFASDDRKNDSKRFYYDGRWKGKNGFEEVVVQGWNGSSQDEYMSLSDRIWKCRHELSKWKKKNNTNSDAAIRRFTVEYEAEVCKISPDHNRMYILKKKLAEAYREEERYWKDRSREQWLKLGDQNTKYFHNCVKNKKVKNRIHMLLDDQGLERFSEGSKGSVAAEYFQKLFTSSEPEDLESVFDEFAPRVTEEMNSDLIAIVTDEEIKQAAFSIKGGSGAGADGFNGRFYHQNWHIVGPAICLEVKQFFRSTFFPPEWNFTNICLIPKISNPTRMSEMRPISLCSVHYKIISKILCGRLKRILPAIISETQGAFVSGRLISDNVLIAHEMVHALRTNGVAAMEYMAVKTDMSKAYDRVEWCFLEKLMLKLGFNEQWVKWIMYCVSTVTYSVLINENAHGFIKPERGIRQGDPLSPFLFILCAEALVHLLNKSEKDKKLQGVRASDSGPAVHHLLFADDSLLLCKANKEESLELKRCLQVYGNASGQVINYEKSSIIFGAKVPSNTKDEVKLAMGIDKEGGDGTYLGLPECFSGSKVQMLSFIKESLKSRLSGWFAKSLSQGGKEILLKSVAMSLPVYAMSCFKLPQETCQKITSAMTEFWWNHEKEHKKIPWVAWQSLCRHKELGGLGFRDIGRFNQALLGKQAWRIWDKPSSLLAQVLKHKYFKKKSFLDCGVGHRPSFAWRSILFGRELMKKGLLRKIGNGYNTKVWGDNWIGADIPRTPNPRTNTCDEELRVADLCYPNSNQWNVPLLRQLFVEEDVRIIQQMKRSSLEQDSYTWYFSKNGLYTTQSGYKFSEVCIENEEHQVRNVPQIEQKLWARIWKIKTVSKIRHFIWRALRGALAVKERLQSRGMPSNMICQACDSGPETINHALFLCPRARQVWEEAKLPMPRAGFSSTSTFLNIHHMVACMEKQSVEIGIRRAFPWILWNIWKARNTLTFEKIRLSSGNVIQKAYDEAEEWYAANHIQDRLVTRGIPLREVADKWSPPNRDFIKCNVGSAWRSDNQSCGVAWILRDHNGLPLFHSRRAYSGIASSLEGDLMGLLWAVENLGNMRKRKVVFEVSSADAWEFFGSTDRSRPCAVVVDGIRVLLNKFEEWKITLTSKVCNVPASRIASSVTEEDRSQSYISQGGPSWLNSLIMLEKP